jgi:hypothetical protein
VKCLHSLDKYHQEISKERKLMGLEADKQEDALQERIGKKILSKLNSSCFSNKLVLILVIRVISHLPLKWVRFQPGES